MSLKKIEIHYYALLREQRGASRENVQTSAATPRELYAELAGRHGFTLAEMDLQVAVNDEFAPWDTVLKDGDQVVFLPPASGG